MFETILIQSFISDGRQLEETKMNTNILKLHRKKQVVYAFMWSPGHSLSLASWPSYQLRFCYTTYVDN